MLRQFFLACLLLTGLAGRAAEERLFTSPIHFPMTLAGNFGEPRPRHFHGGIDIKTEHIEGKPIYAIGEGYVVKATFGINGFGNALYVKHPSGHISIYAHLREFAPRIQAAFRKAQRRIQNDTCEVTFPATMFPVSRGQFIAFSGNTGASMGPHLHLEIHETSTFNMLDPLTFLGDYVDDRTPPKLLDIRAYPAEGQGWFGVSGSFQPGASGLVGWGKVGFAIRAEDYMDSVPNRYGVRYTRFYVDGKQVFAADVNNIPVEDNPLVNVWGDSTCFIQQHRWYLRSYVTPENTLPIFQTDENQGYVLFDQERTYHLKYELSDYFGNTTVWEFVVLGKRKTI